MVWRHPTERSALRFFLLTVLMTSGLVAAEKVALTMKTTGDVRHRPVEAAEFASLHRGIPLMDGHFVATGEDGLAIALFLDDKSQLKIRKNSEVQISGSRQEGAITKQIGLASGTIKASIGRQTREFTITTPTSVASVKGTEFWLIVDPVFGDLLVSILGSIELTNRISGQVITVEPGTVVESTQEGDVHTLVVVQIRGEASTGVSGGRFNLIGMSILKGDVEAQDLSGTIEVVDNTIIEGAEVQPGGTVTVTGTFDEQTGNVISTLVEVSAPITIEGVATSSVTGGAFTISEVTLVSGETETLPTEVRITERTVVEGDEIIAGAEVTVVGNYNEETGGIEADRIIVVVPQLRITALVTSVSRGAIEVANIAVVVGDVDVSALSGNIIITESTVVEGGDLAAGAKVRVTGTFDETTGDMVATRIVIVQVVLLAVVSSPVVNNEFQITDFSVLEGDIDPSVLSGTVRLLPDTEIEGGEITPGLQVTLTGNVEEDSGTFVATRVLVIVAERELIFEMEDNQGRRRELVIRFQ